MFCYILCLHATPIAVIVQKIIEIILLCRGWSYNIILVINCVHKLKFYYILHFCNSIFQKTFTRQYGFPFETNKLQCRYCWQYICVLYLTRCLLSPVSLYMVGYYNIIQYAYMCIKVK